MIDLLVALALAALAVWAFLAFFVLCSISGDVKRIANALEAQNLAYDTYGLDDAEKRLALDARLPGPIV